MVEAEGRRKERGSRKEIRRERIEKKKKEKTQKIKKDGSQKNSREMGNLG